MVFIKLLLNIKSLTKIINYWTLWNTISEIFLCHVMVLSMEFESAPFANFSGFF